MPVDINLPPPRHFGELFGSQFPSIFPLRIAALRFQPTKRPPPANHKTGHKPIQAKAVHHVPPVTSTSTPPEAQAASQRNLQKTTIADWTGDGDEDDVNGFYGEKRQRGGRKKRKKNKGDTHIPQNWDDIYDPSRPNNYEEYRHSDEQLREIREWKDRLYAHKMTGRSDTYSDSEDDGYRRPQMSSKYSPVYLGRPSLIVLSRSIRSSANVFRASPGATRITSASSSPTTCKCA